MTASDAATGQGIPVPAGCGHEARRAPPSRASGRRCGSIAGASRPAIVGIGFTLFILYSLVSSLLLLPVFGFPYEVDGYLSPFFSPLIVLPVPARVVLAGDPHPLDPARLPGHLLLLPQGLLPGVLLRSARLRGRRAQRPPDDSGSRRAFPFILQNLHRYFLYLAFIPLTFLWIDAVVSLRHDDQWRIGLGTFAARDQRGAAHLLLVLVPLAAPPRRRQARLLLVHRARSARGTRCGSGSRASTSATTVWAWASLFSVVVADIYVRLLGLGVDQRPGHHVLSRDAARR